MHRIPCIVRSSDGASFGPGTMVCFDQRIYVIKHVFISNDLLKTDVMVVDAARSVRDSNPYNEVTMLALDEITAIKTTDAPEDIQDLAKSIATESQLELFPEISQYSSHVKKSVRKFMLISKLRKSIRFFLCGLEMVSSFNIGLMDWDLDPQILNISAKKPKVIYRIEDDIEDNQLDRLLGPEWDLVDLSLTMDAYRLVLTLEIEINFNGEICVTVHAVTFQERPDLTAYRSQYLAGKHCEADENSSIVATVDLNQSEVTENPLDQSKDIKSLVWDSLQDMPRASTPCRRIIVEETQMDTICYSPGVMSENSEEKLKPGNTNRNSYRSESESSGRPLSRLSARTHSTTASRPAARLQGLFQKTSFKTNNVEPQCPFPNEWQFGTVPEVVTNCEDID